MKTYYMDPGAAAWQSFFLSQQHGGAIPGFEGMRYQRGSGLGSLFRGFLRMILPAAKTLGKSAVKAIGREALSSGSELAGDVLRGEDIKVALKKRGRNAAGNLLTKAGQKLSQAGSGKVQKGHGVGKRQRVAGITIGTKQRPKKKRATKKGSFMDTLGH
jgi:hypothetical protein